MKKTLLLVLLVITGLASVFAADKTATKKVCDTDVHPIDLGEDVLGISLIAAGGQWVEVDAQDNTKIIKENASNVFRAIDRQPGVYVFIYKAKNNLCMEDGKTAKATVEILETPKPININLLMCDGDTKDLDLKKYLSATFLSKYKDYIKFEDANGKAIANGIFKVTDKARGAVQLKYELAGLTEYPCVKAADIAVNISRESDYADKKFSTVEKTFCVDALPKSLNLNMELGLASTIDAEWTAPKDNSAAPAVVAGVITLDKSKVVAGTYTYTYTFSKDATCGLANKTTTFKLTIGTDFSDLKAETISICKVKAPNNKVDMMSALNYGLPLSSGVWSIASGVNNPTVIDVKKGYFDVSKATVGTYTYKFKVSEAADLCGLAGKSVLLKFIIENGGSLSDGEVQLCSASLPEDLKLSKYIAGLAADAKVKWSKFNPDGADKVVENGVFDASGLEYGTYKFIYETGSSECKSSGILYVSVVDGFTNFSDKEVRYCISDTDSDSIDLDEILGVAGIPGTWTVKSNAVAANYDAATHVFKGKTQGKGSYQFTFTADENAGCDLAGKNAVITVNITDDLITK